VSVVAPAPAAPARPRRRPAPATPAPRRERARAARPALARPRAGRSPVGAGVIWVLLLATLFGGIVALNVGALRNSIAASRIDGEAAALRSQNSDLASQIVAHSGYGRISQLARNLGMVQAQPSRRDYLRLHPRSDAGAVHAQAVPKRSPVAFSGTHVRATQTR
jgi:hypothetical protein